MTVPPRWLCVGVLAARLVVEIAVYLDDPSFLVAGSTLIAVWAWAFALRADL
jgi:hypothetical protein